MCKHTVDLITATKMVSIYVTNVSSVTVTRTTVFFVSILSHRAATNVGLVCKIIDLK